MGKRAKEVSAELLRRLHGRHKELRTARLYAVGGVAGLFLRITPSGAASWILRVIVAGRRRDIGVGSYPEVGLAKAREKAKEMRDEIAQGQDPIAERLDARLAKRAAATAAAKRVTFNDCVARFLLMKAKEFTNPKHISQWESTLRDYAAPVIGDRPVGEITRVDIEAVLVPLWETKTETATRVRGRIEAVLNWATVNGYRHGDNPARWKGNLAAVLPAPTKLKAVKHHKALPWRDIYLFMLSLRERQGVSARCLEFLILTGTRSGEARGAKWDELDLSARLWTIPAERMKMGKQHIVPLCDDAIALLERTPRLSEIIFPSPSGGVLSDVGLTKPLRLMGLDVTVHGFRSTFRDWMAECTNHPHYVQEMALAHGVGSEVEKAYRRGDLLAKRTELMRDWCRYINTPTDGEIDQ
jgi:integrase